VLVVGPREPLRDTLCHWLRQRRYEVEAVERSEHALLRVDSTWYDAVVVDAQVGSMSCLQMVRELRRRCPHQTLLVHRDTYGVVPILHALQSGADEVVPRITNTEGFELLELVLARGVATHRAEREARRLHEQLKRLGSGELSEVVRRTTHDMNQPLTVIMGTVDLLLLELPDDSEMREDLETVLRESQRLRTLATSLGSLVVSEAVH